MRLFQFDRTAERGSPVGLHQAPSGWVAVSNFVISEPALPPCFLIHKSGICHKENVSGGLPVSALCIGVSHHHNAQNVQSPLSILQNRTREVLICVCRSHLTERTGGPPCKLGAHELITITRRRVNFYRHIWTAFLAILWANAILSVSQIPKLHVKCLQGKHVAFPACCS